MSESFLNSKKSVEKVNVNNGRSSDDQLNIDSIENRKLNKLLNHVNVYFHVMDTCNMRCTNCHWFSEDIKVMNKIRAEDIINFLQREIEYGTSFGQLIFSGGEPLLWNDLAKTINGIPTQINDIRIFTNGSLPNRLRGINRDIFLRISIHNDLDWQMIKECIKISSEKEWKIKFVAFEDSIDRIFYPDWFSYEVTIKKEQMKFGHETISHLIDKKIRCTPKKIYFGTDGRAYFCEKGLRTKDDKNVEDFTLWSGVPKIRHKECIVDESCIGNIVNEQYYQIS